MPIDTHLIFSVNAQSSERLKQWMDCRDSLTEKLMKMTGEADLQLISQCWVNVDWWGKNLLHLQDEIVFQREILMKSQGIIYWYAKSIIPKTCYDLEPSFFDRLKKESIKNLIFGNDNKVQRQNMHIYPVNRQCIEFYWAEKYVEEEADIFWVRLAEFSFRQKGTFYLLEIILPPLEFLS